MHLMHLLSIAYARHSLDLEASCFLPDALLVQTLVAAVTRGIRVRILVPDKHRDSEAIRVASKPEWDRCFNTASRFANTNGPCCSARR